MDRSSPGSSTHGILQARILECVAMPSTRGSSLYFSTQTSEPDDLYSNYVTVSSWKNYSTILWIWNVEITCYLLYGMLGRFKELRNVKYLEQYLAPSTLEKCLLLSYLCCYIIAIVIPMIILEDCTLTSLWYRSSVATWETASGQLSPNMMDLQSQVPSPPTWDPDATDLWWGQGICNNILNTSDDSNAHSGLGSTNHIIGLLWLPQMIKNRTAMQETWVRKIP